MSRNDDGSAAGLGVALGVDAVLVRTLREEGDEQPQLAFSIHDDDPRESYRALQSGRPSTPCQAFTTPRVA